MDVQQADPLEEVLALVGTTGHLSIGLVAGGEWAMSFEPPPAVKFNAVRRGRCLLTVEGVPGPIELAEGDCFLLTQPRAFTLASGPGVRPVPAGPVFLAATDGVARVGADEDVALIGGRFDFGERAKELLLDVLPPVIHVPGRTAEAATVRWALDQIDAELRDRPLASTLVAEHLALVMLIHLLRLHLAGAGTGEASGWLAGLADPVVAPALRAMHGRPAHAWTVAELAGVAAVSRSTLAARFKHVVGQGPLEYLTGWRMELATDRLRRGDDTVAAIAREVGYGSESALSSAFKRITGTSPRDYRRRLRSVDR
ncbi:helix-turn-helix domain-containing protein [Nonomuraea phyllanthi]|uniref:Helix-turn-helix domain-containing protein n=1 Tax=Nonomuraea phyllanthi TaxID=2219224 RepID=A0A5C4VBE5_9ACTN|nr:AraC family transcriptional regulator [Nonomuraea phyllanthi]KAB8191277.1 helix-turn-helix domain-containing protein [Nonomuraea phyllanthi]QFY12663.1 helix-turn-helix domain-containing protein [Nonomuraea phyllanthi]